MSSYSKYSHLIKPVQVRLERISENTCNLAKYSSVSSSKVTTELKTKSTSAVTKDCFVLLKDLSDPLPLIKLEFENDIDNLKKSKGSQYEEVSVESRNNFTCQKLNDAHVVIEDIMQHIKVEQLDSDDSSNLDENLLEDATSVKVFDSLKNATIKEEPDSKDIANVSTIGEDSPVCTTLPSLKLERCDRKDEVLLIKEILKQNVVISLKRLITPCAISSTRQPKRRRGPFKKSSVDEGNSELRVKRLCRDGSTHSVSRFQRPPSASPYSFTSDFCFKKIPNSTAKK